MSRRTKAVNMAKKRFYTEILTDRYFYPATKVLLMYILESVGVYYLAKQTEQVQVGEEAFQRAKKELNLSDYHWHRAIKQLKEINIIE